MAKVTLEIGSVELVFNPEVETYNKFINEMQMNNKMAPSTNYIRRIVDKNYKDALNDILVNSPGAALQIAAAINDEFAPELEITVKK
ncbi:putative phage tail assembly chaperone [Pragia fontium]|uniref:Phage tail assembly chaperone n=1 Tax=Pragia fontium DSM 5563 = ATCC 49100 TaxID=1122977 RepID=A0AAJ4W9H4_9GAMM|nr:putative phage tail assembly chaperone [Pragia fontium]SFC49902.1 Phage tail assembly chaperone [Pragia fontium DSM 5563 = ATCC 49100]